MNPPTDRALIAWYRSQPKGDYTCAWCGKIGPDHYVQPQHPFWAEGRQGIDGKAPARCGDCINEAHRQARERRTAQLAAEPRCEIDGCNRRGAWKIAGALLCGAHLKAAQREHARIAAPLGILGGLVDVNRSTVLHWAGRK